MMAISSVICSDLVPLKNRGLYQGIGESLRVIPQTMLIVLHAANVFFGAGSGLGGPIGGWISDNIGWRVAFLGAYTPPRRAIRRLTTSWQSKYRCSASASFSSSHSSATPYLVKASRSEK